MVLKKVYHMSLCIVPVRIYRRIPVAEFNPSPNCWLLKGLEPLHDFLKPILVYICQTSSGPTDRGSARRLRSHCSPNCLHFTTKVQRRSAFCVILSLRLRPFLDSSSFQVPVAHCNTHHGCIAIPCSSHNAMQRPSSFQDQRSL